MINKKSIWFLTLFSLILVLSVYYITMPSELLLNTNGNYQNNTLETGNIETSNTSSIEESTYLVSLRVSKEEDLLKEMENLQLILTNESASIDEKNNAYNKMKELNHNKAEEEKLEKLIKDTYSLEGVVKIKGNQIEIVIKSSEKSTDIANQIMRKIQENYQDEKYITVKFID